MTLASAPTGGPDLDHIALDGGRYALEVLLARSPSSEVYRGHDRRLGRRVVIKVPGDDESARRIAREAEVLARLRHPRVGSLLDVARLDGAPCLVLEVAGAASLETITRTYGAAPLLRALTWMRDVLEALRYLHAHGLAHLDVKPANLVLGPDGRVTVVDLGVAAALGGGARIEAGTPRYHASAAPARATVATDLYAAGVTLESLLDSDSRDEVRHLADRLCGRTGVRPYASASEALDDLARHSEWSGSYASVS